MALLKKKIKGSTLMETLVATVLIVIIFMISSMILNNILRNNVHQNTELAQERINALEYKYINGGLELPYIEEFESWEISISAQDGNEGRLVVVSAENPKAGKSLKSIISYAD